jgi:hypothetical protein
MARLTIWILALGLVCGTAISRAAADASHIAVAMGDLRWGLSESEVTSFVKRKLDERYTAQIQKTHDAGKQAKLKSDLKRAQSEVSKGLVEFTGSSSRWDRSPVAGEFTYGNGESMLVAKDEGSENYYFFLGGRLWKWFKVLDKDAFGHGDFKKFSQSIESKFGKGRAKKGELAPGQGDAQWLEYMDRNSRMRAADAGSKRGVFALIFEEMSTVRELASTRPTKPSRLAGKAEDDESEVKSDLKSAPSTSGSDREVAKASTKRSIFGKDSHEETEAEYQARKQKAAGDNRDRQVRAHERKEEQKKGEVLKQLDAVNDSDPLGGL